VDESGLSCLIHLNYNQHFFKNISKLFSLENADEISQKSVIVQWCYILLATYNMLMHTIVKVLKPLSREFSIVLLLPKVHVEGTHGINFIDKKLTTCCEQSALAIVAYSVSSTRLKSKNCQLRSELL